MITCEVEKENLVEELESERENAEKLSESQEWLKRKVMKPENALMAKKQVSEGMKSNLKFLSKDVRSEVRDMMDGVRRMIKTQALPESCVLDKEGDFGEFKRTFLLKYNNVTEGPEEIVDILEEKFLKGPAKLCSKHCPKGTLDR
uniref:Uncharacterized protein n=1 Tax=Caenorhabditis japonica TaxID=281687 RepID=A0A8R1IU53_CAEJA